MKYEKIRKYDLFCQKYGKEEVERWIKEVLEGELFNCLYTCSNEAFNNYDGKHHRDKYLNILDFILKNQEKSLYMSSTYGVCPATVCYEEIGYLTDRRYENYDIAMFLVNFKLKKLKKWILKNINFDEREKKLLHYYTSETEEEIKELRRK